MNQGCHLGGSLGGGGGKNHYLRFYIKHQQPLEVLMIVPYTYNKQSAHSPPTKEI